MIQITKKQAETTNAILNSITKELIRLKAENTKYRIKHKQLSTSGVEMSANSKRPQTGGLCFRCEHRARYLETGNAPRCECGTTEHTSHSCYMYKPVLPCVTHCEKGDKRPRLAGWGFSAREQYHHVATDKELKLNVLNLTRGCIVLYYEPVSQKDSSNCDNKRDNKLPNKRKSKGKC